MKVTALAGGTGSSKLLRGLARLPIELTVIPNVGDNIWMYGVYVCPDIDITCYSLAGIADRKKGWGIDGDTFDAMSLMSRLGLETWFRLGDGDLSTCLARTEMMRRGDTLTKATNRIRRAIGIRQSVLPVTDAPVETRISTGNGELHLQEFWVRDRGKPTVKAVAYRGAMKAKVTTDAREALARADRIIICPANPVTSIGPMLSVPGFQKMLAQSRAKVVALSPMEGRSPFSGPALNLMKAIGVRGDSVGVAEMYAEFLDGIIISERDKAMKEEIESFNVNCTLSNTTMRTEFDETRLAKELVEN